MAVLQPRDQNWEQFGTANYTTSCSMILKLYELCLHGQNQLGLDYKNMSESVTEFDSPWKTCTRVIFEDFILFFLLPTGPLGRSRNQGYEFLDKELQQVVWMQIGRRAGR